MDQHDRPPEEPAGLYRPPGSSHNDDAPEPPPGSPVTPEEFHEQLQQRPHQGDEPPQPVYGQPPAPQYQPPQYTQPDYHSIPTPQQQSMGGDYRPYSQPTHDRPAQPPQPTQYDRGDYHPDQPPQYGSVDYGPPQPPSQGYYSSGPYPGPPPQGKKGIPAWAWVMPLALILLVGGGIGTWMFMSNQQKTASVANSEATVVAMRTVMAVARATITSEAAASATAQEMAFATIIAGLDATATAWTGDAVPTLPAADIFEPRRMPVDEFISLYEDPARRPIIVDVRSTSAYEEGHIKGAVSIPGDQTESRLSELPKDRLIVAYCQ